MSMGSRVIINSDDFGLCSGINRAVKQAHTTGVLSSATIMSGMPGADEAVRLAKEMPELGIGVHLNLLESRPVSKDKRIEVLLDSKGEFVFSAVKLAIMSALSKAVRNAIEIELAAQVEWLIDKGISPTHLDSHKHIHAFPWIYPIVVRLAERFNIAAIRWPFEPKRISGSDWPSPTKGGIMRARIVRTMAKINRRQNDKFIRNDMFLGVAHTGRIDTDFWRKVSKNSFRGLVEVMTHPGFAEGLNPAKTRLIEQRQIELEALCSEQTKKLLADANIELVHYGKL